MQTVSETPKPLPILSYDEIVAQVTQVYVRAKEAGEIPKLPTAEMIASNVQEMLDSEWWAQEKVRRERAQAAYDALT